MPITNFITRQVEFKIVYYGAEFAGKSTNLRSVHATVDAASRSPLSARQTGADQTMFFDFLLEGVSFLDGFKTRVFLYTVPGHVVFNAPRQLVLHDADGIVFVVDSRWERMEENANSFHNLQENLKKAGLVLGSIPYVIQYNKRDLPDIAPLSYLDFVFNHMDEPAPVFEAVASSGKNVLGTLNAVCQSVLGLFAEQVADHPAARLQGIEMTE